MPSQLFVRSGTRPRLIAALLLLDGLAHISYGYSEYEYVGDPINILNLLSGFEVDEVLIVDLTASKHGSLSIPLLGRLRAVADFPLAYAGGIKTIAHADKVMSLGYDKMFLSASNPYLVWLLGKIAERYGKQAVAISIDYCSGPNGRYLFNPYARERTTALLSDILSRLPLDLASDLLFSCVERTGYQKGIDHEILQDPYINSLRNPIILAGGLQKKGGLLLRELIDIHSTFAGIAASSSIFLQSGSSSALVCLERHFA